MNASSTSSSSEVKKGETMLDTQFATAGSRALNSSGLLRGSSPESNAGAAKRFRNERLTTVIGPLPRSERCGRGRQGGPMNNESITFAVQEPYAAVVCGNTIAGATPLEALGRALGYTQKELALAGDVLNRFVWQSPVGEDSEQTLGDKVRKAA
jgi:hypothetical protein